MTNKDLLYSTWNSAQCYVVGWMRGEFGGEWIRVNVWLSPFAAHLKLSQHLISCMLIQNKKFIFFNVFTSWILYLPWYVKRIPDSLAKTQLNSHLSIYVIGIFSSIVMSSMGVTMNVCFETAGSFKANL